MPMPPKRRDIRHGRSNTVDETEEFEFRARAEAEAGSPAMSGMESAKQTAIGAGQELGRQGTSFAQGVGQNFKDLVSGPRSASQDQSTLARLGQAGSAIADAVTHPRQTMEAAETAVADWGERIVPQGGVQTPEQARERGAAGVQGVEKIAPGVGLAGDIARLGALPVERALAPMAEKVAARGEAKVAEATEAGQQKADLIRDVRKLGLKLTSQDAGKPIGKRLEAMASRPELERDISRDNAEAAKKAAAADVGIKDPLTPGSVTQAINDTLPKYTAPRKLGRVDLASDQKWQDTLKEAKGISSQEKLDFPEDFNESVEKEIAKFDKPSADADTLVSKVRKLRERASDNFRGGGAEQVELARVQRKLATAMEEAIERHGEKIGQGSVIKDFRDARVRLAKLYSIRDAMAEDGELDLGVLARDLAKGEPLTGNLRTLARAKSVFDRSFQLPGKIRGHPLGTIDYALAALVGGGKGAASGGIPGAIAGTTALAARPATRALLASRPYQKAFIKPKVPKTGVVTRAARGIADAGKKPKVKPRAPTLQDLEDARRAAQ
jgi:hypothetical protein